MKIFQKSKKLVTHNGSFHADDIFACATLMLMLEKKGKSGKVYRTRDEKIINKADYVFDVGGIYDAEKDKFDHHQIGGAGKRENEIEYSSFGLVWKKFGEEVCGSKEVAYVLEKKIVMPVDAFDNGIDIIDLKSKVRPYNIQLFFMSFRPRWQEVNDKNLLAGFKKSVKIAKELLTREILLAGNFIDAKNKIEKIYTESENKKIIILDKKYPWEDIISKYEEPLFVVFPRIGGLWGAEGVFIGLPSHNRRKNFPEAWGGKRDKDLQEISGVPDAVFCHKGLFMVVAKSKEGAIKLAQIALES